MLDVLLAADYVIVDWVLKREPRNADVLIANLRVTEYTAFDLKVEQAAIGALLAYVLVPDSWLQ